MLRTSYILLVIVFFGCLPLAQVVAQPPGLPSPPTPVTAQPPPVQVQATPVPTYDPGQAVGNIPFVQPAPIFPNVPNAGVVPPTGTTPCQTGYFGSLEIAVIFPEIHGTLIGPVTLTGLPPTTVALGSANLASTGSPRVEFGYRFGEDTGAAAVSYRSFVSKGGDNVGGSSPFGNPFLSSLFNINVVDIDYASPAYNFAPFWDFSWRGGLRVAGVYYQNVLTGKLGQAEATSNFVGAGPHAEVEFGRAVEVVPGLAVLAKLDGAVMGGSISQSFSESFNTTPPLSGESRFSHGEAVPVLTFDLGISYTPPGTFSFARLGFGYQFEYWWDIGNAGSSKGDLLGNGFYFRGEFNF
jgi:Legionella pneumophila major outer membrane protein precursor